MPYIERALERKFLRMSSFFKAVLVTGARQVGKTTMLKHLAEGQNRSYVTMDNTMARILPKQIPCCSFKPTSLPSSLTRYKKPRNCLNKLRLCVMKPRKEACSG